jgi:hypothetical protein
VSDRTSPNDPVEESMGEGTVLRRDKVVARSLALICLAMFLAFGVASIAYLKGWQADKPAIFRFITYGLVPLMAWVGLTKTVLRTVVTTSELHVAQGFRELRVAIASITACRLFGNERVQGGTDLYFPKGPGGILVEWRDATGKARKALIGSDDPTALLAAVERARGGAGRVRVTDAEPPATREDEQEEETDLDGKRRGQG